MIDKMYYKKILPVLVILVFVTAIIFVSNSYYINNKQFYYYAYGDSITRANGYGDLPDNGNASYILKLRDEFDSTAPADHNMDGGSKTSKWGLTNIESHINFTSDNFTKYTPIVVFMFGANDQKQTINGNECGNNYIGIIDYIEKHGGLAVPVICPLMENGTGYLAYNNQKNFIKGVESVLKSRGKKYIKGYDAVDTIPNNGNLDYFNSNNYAEGVHLNVTGQRILGEFIWGKLHDEGWIMNKI